MTVYAVVGTGLMGRVIARDLLDSEPDASVVLSDRDPQRLRDTAAQLQSARATTRPVDLPNADDTARGLLRSDPISVEGHDVIPRAVLLAAVGDGLALGAAGDTLAMRVLVDGVDRGRAVRHMFELVDHHDPQLGDSAMARTMGFTAACAARMITSGTLEARGVRFPEQLYTGERFETMRAMLGAKGVSITHHVRDNP